jgi:hypothetical protein
MRYLASLFKLAGVQRGHAHRFRDTLAVELLLAGVPLERVSMLLGSQFGHDHGEALRPVGAGTTGTTRSRSHANVGKARADSRVGEGDARGTQKMDPVN